MGMTTNRKVHEFNTKSSLQVLCVSVTQQRKTNVTHAFGTGNQFLKRFYEMLNGAKRVQMSAIFFSRKLVVGL